MNINMNVLRRLGAENNELIRFVEIDYLKNLKRTGISGIFAASLELTREGIISIMQKKPFQKLLIKEKK